MSNRPSVNIQWQNTEACIDLWCDCGLDGHLDGLTSGYVQCSGCGTVWVLTLTMRAKSASDYPHTPTLLTTDDE